MTANDLDLVAAFARDQSQDAFTALVKRHLDLVYCTALRQVRSPQLAEEVAQSVFTDLARSAARLKPDTILTAWLYEVARRTAIDVVRGEVRRQLREQIASEMNVMNATVDDWTHIEPLLDEAMHALDATDRAAVLLRYFQNKSLREVGESLGASEEAARKRISRAVERLREFFVQRGVTVGAGGLAVVISANAVQIAPIGLAATISSAALTSVGASSGILTFLQLMTTTKLKLGIVSAIVLMGLIIALHLRRERSARIEERSLEAATESASATQTDATSRPGILGRGVVPRAQEPAPAVPPEQIVAGKLSQFAHSRRDLARALARRHGVAVSDIVERFFAAAEAGHWEEMQALFDSMEARRKQQPPAPDLDAVWGPIHETLGLAEETRKWPAQKLLDYGNAVLDALRPGMVYIGGTDPGRFIPTLLNETSEGEHRIVLSQNPLGDRTYLDYLSFQYGDRLSTLTRDDSERAFQSYLTDAQKRLEHDQQFPDEPRQVRPGEDIRIIDGKVEFSGDMAWMAINEQLLRTLMEKNPNASFAIEQSYPFTSMYADTRPLSPIMELRVQDEQNALTHERAAQSADFWRVTAQQFLADPEAPAALNTRMAYAKIASEQAALLDYHHHAAEAEQAYRSASEIWPSRPEAVFRLTNLLIGQNRLEDAFPVAEAALSAEPGNRQFLHLMQKLTLLRQNR